MKPDEPASPHITREFDALSTERAEPQQIRAIARDLTSSLRATRPLPSDRTLILLCISGFALLAILGALPVGYTGFHRLDLLRRLILYPVVLISVLPLAVSTATSIVPGSRVRVPLLAAILFPLIVLALVTPILFPEFGLARFVKDGVPCLRLGTICAILADGFVYVFIRQGFITEPRSAALTAGAFTGCVGVGVLALHCPIQNASHILAWHLGVIPVSVVIGMLFLSLFNRT